MTSSVYETIENYMKNLRISNELPKYTVSTKNGNSTFFADYTDKSVSVSMYIDDEVYRGKVYIVGSSIDVSKQLEGFFINTEKSCEKLVNMLSSIVKGLFGQDDNNKII